MNRRFRALFLLAGIAATGFVCGAEPLPETGTVIQRFVERSMHSASNRLGGGYSFFRTNITESYSRQGEVSERTEKIYRVLVADGDRDTELLSVNGRTTSSADREKDRERQRRKREGGDRNETPDRSRQMDAFITLEILSRYVFEVQAREVIDGRSALLVSFKPATGEREADKMMDRVLDRIGGVLWIDEEESELVKADISLREKVSIWGGLLGGLEQLQLIINRQRELDGRWRDRRTEARFVGRAVTKRFDGRTQDLSSASAPTQEQPQVAAD